MKFYEKLLNSLEKDYEQTGRIVSRMEIEQRAMTLAGNTNLSASQSIAVQDAWEELSE